MQTPYILMAIVAIIIILLLIVFIKKPKQPQPLLSPLTILALFSIIAGLTLTNNNKLVSYCLFGLGVVLAVIDIGLKTRNEL